MRAYVVEQADGAFTLVGRPQPRPGKGQVLVRVHASGVNPLDAEIRAGKAAHANRQAIHRSCYQLSGVGHACSCTALVRRRDVLWSLRTYAAPYRTRTASSRRNSS